MIALVLVSAARYLNATITTSECLRTYQIAFICADNLRSYLEPSQGHLEGVEGLVLSGRQSRQGEALAVSTFILSTFLRPVSVPDGCLES